MHTWVCLDSSVYLLLAMSLLFLDWTTKPLKLATGKTDFFQGIDINVSKVKASNPEVFTENKFKIKCEVSVTLF